MLARDYNAPRYHISYPRAIGRRLRRNYAWIFGIQGIAYYGKIIVHPTAIQSWNELWERTSIGPIPGGLVVLLGLFFYIALCAFALTTAYLDRMTHKDRSAGAAMG